MKRTLFLTAVLTVSTCWAQEPMPNAQQSFSPVQPIAPVATDEQTIVIPVGTRIPLTLTSPIAAKSARPGYAVRAVTGFPVTVGTQMAIPVGVYVEGAIDKLIKGGRSGPSLQMHFTRILYANGYSVPVDGANVVARAFSPESRSPESTAYSMAGTSASAGEPNYALASQQLPSQPPLPRVGPNVGTIAGVSIGVTAAVIVAGLLFGRHHGVGNGVLFDTGWQFDMVLKSPVSVNAASIAAAVASPNAQ